MPQVEPGALFPPLTQASAPVEQSVTPFWQRPGFVPHVIPEEQVMHAPLPLQTCPAPQLVPAEAFMVPSTQTVLPVLQSVRPRRQGPDGLLVHAMFGTQAPQLPLASQTWPAPHMVPADLLLPSTHVWLPVAHEVMPFRQPGLGLVVQGEAAMQLMQLPLVEQT